MPGPLREEDGQLVGSASAKALKMRGYDVDAASGSVEEYATSSAFDNSAEALSNPAEERWYAPGIEGLADELSYKPTLKEMAKTVASEAEWGKVLANQPKMVGEWLGELIPMARRMLPVDPTLLFDEDLTWGDVGQSMKYSWLPGVSFAKNMMTTDVKGKNFRKISKTQDHEEMLVPYLEQYRDLHVLTEDKLVDKLNEYLNLDVVSIDDLVNKYKGNQQVHDAVMAFKAKMGEKYLDENDWYEDEDYFYIKNFKEEPKAINAAWTRFGDLSLPNLGIIKLDDEGGGKLINKGIFSYEDIPGLGTLQDKGYIGTAEDPMGMYQGLWGGENDATNIASTLLGLPVSIATGNVKSVLNAPKVLGRAGKIYKGTRPFSNIVDPQTYTKTIPQGIENIWQNKGKVGTGAGIGTLEWNR